MLTVERTIFEFLLAFWIFFLLELLFADLALTQAEDIDPSFIHWAWELNMFLHWKTPKFFTLSSDKLDKKLM